MRGDTEYVFADVLLYKPRAQRIGDKPGQI